MTMESEDRRSLKGILLEMREGPLARLWPYLLVAAVTILLSLWMQWGTEDMFPNGDSYIHLSYARSLAETGRMNFNPGIQEGIGSTSMLWVVVLALIQKLTAAPIFWTRMLGIGLLALSACLIYDLVWVLFKVYAPKAKRAHAVAIALLATASGSLLWIAQTGMETIFWMTLVLLALKAYQTNRRVLLGILLGLFALTRIEGVLLSAAVLLVDLIHHRRITRDMWKTAIPVAVIVLPWLIYLQLREGSPTTSSFIARDFYMKGLNMRIAEEIPALEWVIKISPLFYAVQWFGFLAFYATGLVSIGGPLLSVRVMEIGTSVMVSQIGIIIGALITLIVCVILFRTAWLQRKLFSFTTVEGRLLLISGLWLLAHNLAFGFLMPGIGAAGRYVPFNNTLYWVFIGIAALVIFRGRAKFIGVAFAVLLTGLSLFYWRQLYQAHVVNMTVVRQAGAEFVDEHLPADEPIGGIDLGILRYYARQQLVDMAGHVNNEVLAYWEADDGVANFVVDKQLCHISLQGPVEGIGLDMASAMGLLGDERFALVQEAVFSTSIEEWQRGMGPILYMPAAIIYRVDWRDPSICGSDIVDS